jgi:inorganic pyrophosphatase
MREIVVEIEITQPGRPTGQYHFVDHDLLRLENVYYPKVTLPFDVGILPKTLTAQGTPLQVILLGDIPHSPRTQVSARLLGGAQTDGKEPYLVAVPACDDHFKAVLSIGDLADSLRSQLCQSLGLPTESGHHWLDAHALKPWLKETSLKYRQARAEGYQSVSQPAWRPADLHGHVTSYTETEHYTAAEYTFFQLPYHIQHYVSAYLADDERILYAIHRPAMRSHRQRSWVGGEKLNQGVLILTTQRLIHLVELVPLGAGNVRYGFNAHLGVLERLTSITVETVDDKAVLLKTCWQAKEGVDTLEWETPLYTNSAVLELAGFLEKFLPAHISPLALLRATLPDPPDPLPELRDLAAKDPGELASVNQRFRAALVRQLSPDEKVYAWALWPAWFEDKDYMRVLIVTNGCVLVLPDPDLDQRCTLEISLRQIATLEYVRSILNSHIGLHLVEAGKVRQIQLSFPYPAEDAFHRCFEAMRSTMAVFPLRKV